MNCKVLHRELKVLYGDGDSTNEVFVTHSTINGMPSLRYLRAENRLGALINEGDAIGFRQIADLPENFRFELVIYCSPSFFESSNGEPGEYSVFELLFNKNSLEIAESARLFCYYDDFPKGTDGNHGLVNMSSAIKFMQQQHNYKEC